MFTQGCALEINIWEKKRDRNEQKKASCDEVSIMSSKTPQKTSATRMLSQNCLQFGQDGWEFIFFHVYVTIDGHPRNSSR